MFGRNELDSQDYSGYSQATLIFCMWFRTLTN